MARAVEGLKNEALRAALQAALAAQASARSVARSQVRPQYEALAKLLAKHGGLPGLRPNLKLAAAFGAEVAQLTGQPVDVLLDELAAEDAAPDTARAFLPVAAAHGYVQRILVGSVPSGQSVSAGQSVRSGQSAPAGQAAPFGQDVESAWRRLQLLAADERAPVRAGVIDALSQLAAREGQVDALVQRADAWLDEPEREVCYGAVATALEVLSASACVASVRGHAALHGFLSRVLQSMADAPRSASRSAAFKRVLRSMPNMLANMVAASRAAHGSADWFRGECERTRDPELRALLSEALARLAELRNAPPRGLIDELRAALSASQKPLRDPTRVRPGTGRGRRSRPLR